MALLVVALLGGTAMAAGAPGPTVEEQRDELFQVGSALRERLVDELRMVQEISVTPREAVLRNQIARAERVARELVAEFVAYDTRVADLIQTLATVKTLQTPQGAQAVDLNMQLTFAVYVSQLTNHRETIRAILRDINEVISARRSQANSLVALIVSIGSVFVAVFLGIVNLMAK